MREYRVWNEKLNEYVLETYVNQQGKVFYYNRGTIFPLENCIIEWATGLKDRKRTAEYPEGQKIFEGDRVRCCEDGCDEDIFIIEYKAYNDYPAFDLNPSVDCDSNGLSYYMAVGEIEVIGTVHDKENT